MLSVCIHCQLHGESCWFPFGIQLRVFVLCSLPMHLRCVPSPAPSSWFHFICESKRMEFQPASSPGFWLYFFAPSKFKTKNNFIAFTFSFFFFKTGITFLFMLLFSIYYIFTILEGGLQLHLDSLNTDM